LTVGVRVRLIRRSPVLGASVAVLPPREKEGKQVNTGIRMSEDLLQRLQEVAAAENYSRNEVIAYFLRWALKAYEAEREEEKKSGKRGH
jgi:hypothetical protein